MVDELGNVVLVNRETERMFEFERGELIGRPASNLVAESSDPPFSIVKGQPLEPRKLQGVRKSGTTFPLEVSLNPIELETGAGVMASLSDTSVRDQAESVLRQSRTAQISFVAAAAVALIALLVGMVGVPKLEAVNEELSRVESQDISLLLEVAEIRTLLLRQATMFQQALNFARLWQDIPEGASSEQRALADRYLGQYNRYFSDYDALSRQIEERLESSRSIIGNDESYETARKALSDIRRMHENRNKRVVSVFDLVDTGEVSSALSLAQEVGWDDQEVSDNATDVYTHTQAKIGKAVLEAGSLYQSSIDTARVLGAIGGLALMGAILTGFFAVQARRKRVSR